MNALLARTSPGTGKTRAVADAIRRHRVRTRVVTGNLTLARELSDEHGYALIEGRNPNNCQRYDVVEALGSAGHAVAGLACSKKSKPCYPYRGECAYWQQFDDDSEARVGTAEQLFNPNFLRGGNIAVVDDADLSRSLIERFLITTEDLVRAHKRLKGKRYESLRNLVVLLTAAILEGPHDEEGLNKRIIGVRYGTICPKPHDSTTTTSLPCSKRCPLLRLCQRPGRTRLES